MAKIPVILDTDLGDDIDDFWALSYLIRSPEVKPLLINTEFKDTRWRANIAAKLLELAGRSDIPVSAGIRSAIYGKDEGRQRDFVEGYSINDYPGTYRTDGVQAMIDLALASPDPVTFQVIAPPETFSAFVQRAPESLIRKSRLVGMFGSVVTGYGGKPKVDAEWNVKACVGGAKIMFAAPWKEIVLTPLDTCGIVEFTGPLFERVMNSPDKVQQAMWKSSREWAIRGNNGTYGPDKRTSTLFDTVATHLTYTERFLEMEEMRLSITDDGKTVRDPQGFSARVAIRWRDLDGYLHYLADRLEMPTVQE